MIQSLLHIEYVDEKENTKEKEKKHHLPLFSRDIWEPTEGFFSSITNFAATVRGRTHIVARLAPITWSTAWKNEIHLEY